MEEAPTLSYDNSVETLADFGTVDVLEYGGRGTRDGLGHRISHIYGQFEPYNCLPDPIRRRHRFVQCRLRGSQLTAGQRPGRRAHCAASQLDRRHAGTIALPLPLHRPRRTRQGLWLAGKDGGIFALGTAKFHGSTGNIRLQRQITGIAPTADHGGYWMVASDGGLFAFGDAGFEGSVPASGIGPVGSKSPDHLAAPIVGIVPTSNGRAT